MAPNKPCCVIHCSKTVWCLENRYIHHLRRLSPNIMPSSDEAWLFKASALAHSRLRLVGLQHKTQKKCSSRKPIEIISYSSQHAGKGLPDRTWLNQIELPFKRENLWAVSGSRVDFQQLRPVLVVVDGEQLRVALEDLVEGEIFHLLEPELAKGWSTRRDVESHQADVPKKTERVDENREPWGSFTTAVTSAPTTLTSEKYLVALATKDMSGNYWINLPQDSEHIFYSLDFAPSKSETRLYTREHQLQLKDLFCDLRIH